MDVTMTYAVTCSIVVSGKKVVWVGVSRDQFVFGGFEVQDNKNLKYHINFQQSIRVGDSYGMKYPANIRKYIDLESRIWLYVTHYDNSFIYISRWQFDDSQKSELIPASHTGISIARESLSVLDTFVSEFNYVTVMFADRSTSDRVSCKIVQFDLAT